MTASAAMRPVGRGTHPTARSTCPNPPYLQATRLLARDQLSAARLAEHAAIFEDDLAAPDRDRRPTGDIAPFVDRVAGAREHVFAADRTLGGEIPQHEVGVGAD